VTGEQVRVRLDLSYDGTEFHGWAEQPDRRTVAGVLLAGLATLAGPATASGLTVAGRTDAGVHAAGQVCHIDVAQPAWQRLRDSLLRRLAGVLPPDVRVIAATVVTPDFDARFSALARRYEYRVSDAPYGVDPLRRRDTLAWRRPLHLATLQHAAAGLIGEHDFAAYCRRPSDGTTIRAVRRLQWRREPDRTLVATVEADAFCQSMVRSLVGAMLAVGEGSRPRHWPGELLGRRERAGEVRVVAPHGLTLVAVRYPEPAQWAARASASRRRRSLPGGTGGTGGHAAPAGAARSDRG
jgi:tRNA pseudouridine38-40 synthase